MEPLPTASRYVGSVSEAYGVNASFLRVSKPFDIIPNGFKHLPGKVRGHGGHETPLGVKIIVRWVPLNRKLKSLAPHWQRGKYDEIELYRCDVLKVFPFSSIFSYVYVIPTRKERRRIGKTFLVNQYARRWFFFMAIV